MIIEGADFRMTSGASSYFWDLELICTIKPKGGQEREEFKDAGYGMSIESCIKRIIHHRLSRKQDVFTLEEYLQDYKEQVKRLEEVFNSPTIRKMASKLAKSIES